MTVNLRQCHGKTLSSFDDCWFFGFLFAVLGHAGNLEQGHTDGYGHLRFS